jgi:hypothetical protein
VRGQLPHVIHRAVTCPQFRQQLLSNPEETMRADDLEQEDLIVLKEVLGLIAHHAPGEPTSRQDPDLEGGWDGGLSFTMTAISR